MSTYWKVKVEGCDEVTIKAAKYDFEGGFLTFSDENDRIVAQFSSWLYFVLSRHCLVAVDLSIGYK